MLSLSTTSLVQLPTDLSRLIFSEFLSPKAQRALSATSSAFRDLGREQLPSYLKKAHELLGRLSIVTQRAAPTPLAQAPQNTEQLQKWEVRIAEIAETFKAPVEELSERSERPYTDMTDWVLGLYEASAKQILHGMNGGAQILRGVDPRLPLAARCKMLASRLLQLNAQAHRSHLGMSLRTNGGALAIVPWQLTGDRIECVDVARSRVPLEPYNVEEGFDRMPNVRHANLSESEYEDLTYFPNWPHLRYLNLEGNRIKHFPDFSECPELISINLAKNDLRRLPQSLIYHPNWRELNLVGNPHLCRNDVLRLVKGLLLGCATREGRDTILLLIDAAVISEADIGTIRDQINPFSQYTLFSFHKHKTVNGQEYRALIFHIQEKVRSAPNLR